MYFRAQRPMSLQRNCRNESYVLGSQERHSFSDIIPAIFISRLDSDTQILRLKDLADIGHQPVDAIGQNCKSLYARLRTWELQDAKVPF